MSKWDDSRNFLAQREIALDTANAAFSYTVLYPSERFRIWDMLCDGDRDVWTFADLHDFARFAEDFVLCDYVGIPSDLYHRLGPDLFRERPTADEFPLFEADKVMKRNIHEYVKSHSCRLELTSEKVADELLAENEIQLNSEALSAPRATDTRHSMRKMSKTHDKLAKKYKVLEEKIAKEKLRYDEARRELERTQIILALTVSTAGVEYRLTEEHYREFFCRIMAETCLSHGIAVSPSYAMRRYFSHGSINKLMARRLYEEIVKLQEEQHAILEKWTRAHQVDVPPILSILMTQSATRSRLPSELVALRDQFAGLRAEMRKTQETIAGNLPLEERLDAIRRLEAAREILLRKATKNPTKSIIRRTWEIVKSGGLFSISTGIADVLLQWDEDRRLIGGLSHFVDLQRLALLCTDDMKNIHRLFGTIPPK